MRTWTFGLLLALFGSVSEVSAGAQSCLPAFTAGQLLEKFSSDSVREVVQPLTTMRGESLITTRVQLVARNTAEALHLSFRFDPTFDGVSLPFNLFAVLITRDGKVLEWWDFTKSCQAPGLGFFPGRVVELPPVPLADVPSAGPVQIVVWGRL